MPLVPATMLAFIITGHIWLLIAHLIAWGRTRARRPYGLRTASLRITGGLLLLILPRLPYVFLVLAAEGMVGLLSGLFTDTLRCAQTREYASPRDLLCFRSPDHPAVRSPSRCVALPSIPASAQPR